MAALEQCEYNLILKQGYLSKQSTYLRQWRQKWIVLKGFCVLIFNQKPIDHQTNDVVEMYDLSIYDRVEPCNTASFEFKLFSSDANTPATKWRANTNEEMMEWMDCIQKQKQKLSINDSMNVENELNVLSSISELINEGYSCTALRISIHDDENESDEQINIFDPRSMFESEQPHKENESQLATTLFSAINENIDEKIDPILDIECNDMFRDLDYAKMSSSIHDMLPMKKNNSKTLLK